MVYDFIYTTAIIYNYTYIYKKNFFVNLYKHAI